MSENGSKRFNRSKVQERKAGFFLHLPRELASENNNPACRGIFLTIDFIPAAPARAVRASALEDPSVAPFRVVFPVSSALAHRPTDFFPVAALRPAAFRAVDRGAAMA